MLQNNMYKRIIKTIINANGLHKRKDGVSVQQSMFEKFIKNNISIKRQLFKIM